MSPVASKSTTTDKQITSCSNTACPSQVAHNQGYYNFSLFDEDEATRFNKLPQDVTDALNTIYHNERNWRLDDDLDVYIFLAKFTVAHHNHLEGLMPRKTVLTQNWRKPEIRKILNSAGARPVQQDAEPAKEKKKAALPPTRLGNAMGRGGLHAGKTGVTIIYPGQGTPTKAGTLLSFQPSKAHSY